MKFEESSLTQYLVKNLEPLTEADPVILSEYVAALLKKDKSVKELQKLCAEKLVEFLGEATDSFIAKLFKTLEDGSVVEPAKSLDATGPVDLSASLITENPVKLKNSTLNPEVPSCESDHDEKEVSDDDDDDRNHKHKRRETRSQSFVKNVQGNSLRRTNKKHNKRFENGHVLFGNDPQSSENQRDYNPATGRDFSARIDKRRPGRFSMGRGRGRGSTSWNPHDLNFNPIETFDFASQIASQGSAPTSLFASRGLQQFGMIPGMANGGLDTLHPIGLQGALGPQMNQPMSIGMLRQRCRDFEERGFCLRGDMCPMEHGVNRIVVEDVQSLSQFNLPVSLPSAHLQGTPPGAGSLHLGGDPSSLEAQTKSLHNPNNKHGIGDSGFGLNKVSSVSAGAGEADLYDPDQPLWNNDHHSSPKVDNTETFWNGDAFDRHGLDGFGGEQPGRSISSAVGSQSTSSSVWGRIGNSGNKLETAGKFDTNVSSTSFLGNATKDKEKALASIPGTAHQRKRVSSDDADPKATSSAANPRLLGEAARNNGRNSQKALRTVFVNGIPQKNNKKESLLSHFRKFGQVVDIYIPLNSEKAFVQFSKREEAEAALKAPDAVMGNRFIKLWWANRDSIPDSSMNIGDTMSAAPKGVAASVLSQPSIFDRRNESHSLAVPKVSAAPLADHPMSTAVVSPSGTNVPKAAPSSQKKMDTLEVLKEELRIKQEMLDKKRIEFRRQLDMLEKKAVTIKGEATGEQPAKRLKVEMATSPAKTAAPNPSNSIATGSLPKDEKVGGKNHTGESIESPSSKVKSSPKNLKHPNHPSVPLGTLCVANRFKLDNRPTAFRILPPLPADFANVAMLKEHFSKYGDISAVELDELGVDSGVTCSDPSGNCSARITFATRRSAEVAFLNAKCWKDQSLKFSWVVGHNNPVNSHSGRDNSSTATPKGAPDVKVLVETAPVKSSAATHESVSSISQDPACTGKGDLGYPEEIKDADEPMQPLESYHSSENPLSSCHSIS